MNSPEILLRTRIKNLHKLYLRALGSYHAYEEMMEHRAPNIHGHQLAQLRAQSIGVYKGYFNIAQQALQTELYMALSHLYETDKSTLNISKVLSFAVHNQRKILAGQAYRKDDNDRLGLSPEAVQEIEQKLEKANPKIKKLKKIRDKQVGHTSLNFNALEEDYPTYEEFYELIELAGSLINEISRKLYGEKAIFDVYKEQVTQDSRSLLRLVDKSEGITGA